MASSKGLLLTKLKSYNYLVGRVDCKKSAVSRFATVKLIFTDLRYFSCDFNFFLPFLTIYRLTGFHIPRGHT